MKVSKKNKGVRDKSNKLFEQACEVRQMIESDLTNSEGEPPFELSVQVTNIAIAYRDLIKVLMDEKQ
jgi:hypothetical protein